MRAGIGLALLWAGAAGAAEAGPYRGPVIDMHLHAFRVEFAAGAAACPGDQGAVVPTLDPREDFDPAKFITCKAPLHAPATDEALMRDSLAELERYNIRRAVTSGAPAEVAAWRAAAPDRVIPAVGFGTEHPLSVDALRKLAADGEVRLLAEVSTQYRGRSAADPEYEPYFALAEELDLPVGIHLGEGPPAAARFPGYETYRARLTTPFQLEEVLQRHPRLRIYVMHYGSPLVDEMIAMLFTYPNLYVDVACNDWLSPRAQFYDHLKRLVEAGFGKRIMFGSDQMIWPEAIGKSVQTIQAAPFLTPGQKRDILYDNAARFLRLSEAEIAADHHR
jgi:predicted TIM-barrel fold metal-dependent hydrolase